MPRERRGSTTDGTGSAANAAGSATRFSVAMGLFTLRQAARLISGRTAQSAASIERVVGVAEASLDGPARSAYRVAADVEQGMLNAAQRVTTMGSERESPTGPTTALAMSLKTNAARRLYGIRTVASGVATRPVPQAELRRRLARYHDEVMASGPDRSASVDGLWRSEGLATTIAKHPHPDNRWTDPELPRHVLPVEHVGFGSGSATRAHLDAAALHATFAERCVDPYREFSYEGVGAILRARQSGFFKLMSGAMGLMRFDTPPGPDPAHFFAGYLAQYTPTQQRLIAHGYGRIFAFSHTNIYAALQDATALPADRIEPVVHGAAFAFLMINSADLPHILRHSDVPFSAPVRAAFQNGLVYGLHFLEWYAPGYLARWQPEAGLETDLIEHARRESALAIERGVPLAFRLAEPRV